MKKKTHVSPSKASFNEICSIARDSTNVGDFSLICDSCSVTITEQKSGEAPKQSVSMKRATFNRLLLWYLKPSRIIR